MAEAGTHDTKAGKPLRGRRRPADDVEEDGTRARIKAAAMRLFSIHGIDGVSVRNIVNEAGARNGASLHYYFRTKDELIRELVQEAAARSDRARNVQLDALEAKGGPRRVEDVIRLMVEVETVGTGDPEQNTERPIGFGHMRFVVAMQFNHRKMFLDSVGNRWASSYMRCIEHLRRLLKHLPPDILSQRLVFMSLSVNATLAAREAAFEANPSGGSLWGKASALENLIKTTAGSLETRHKA